MTAISKGATVAVTGSTGFIGGWIVRRLLDKGYRVRACVRDVDDPVKTGFLKAMGGYASGRLTLHAADLNSPGCFDEIFNGCQGVCHVSHVDTYDDQDYVAMVCNQTTLRGLPGHARRPEGGARHHRRAGPVSTSGSGFGLPRRAGKAM